ncbi:MAG: AAA family ATPase, partial [Alphaproteobacteria bacterium]|nr:AAA family ATPase [Alphaproteobacteria bacterium]
MNLDIESWLTGLGLEDYVTVFAENRIDFDVLGDLAEADLRELGLALGDRKRLLKAIENMAEPAESEPEAAEPVAEKAHEGERRQVAVLFADISGFTTLAAARDAEEIHQLLNRFFAATDGVVQSFGGNVDKHIGDAVMAVFGAPVAHTDDPERAVRAALALHDAVAELDPPLQIHIGVAAGQVVASSTGSAAHLEYTVTGDIVNLASRLTDLATAGQTLISGAVQSELTERLAGESLGLQTLPGLSEPVSVWRVDNLAEGDAFAEGQFIGRKAERAIFESAVDAVLRNGTGQTLFIRGEAGIGKTRLLHEFQAVAAAHGFQSHGGQVLDFGVGEGQDAVRVMLRSLLGLAPGAGQNLRTAAASRVSEEGLIAPEQRLHLNDLLSLPQPDDLRHLFEAMDIVQRAKGRVETLVSLVSGLSAQSPLLLRLEDLHWAEPALLEYLTGLVQAAAAHPILILLTSRLQNDPLDSAWRGGIGSAAFLAIDLEPLNMEEAQSLVFDIEGVDAEWAAACIDRSGGNPLFLEQLLRSQDHGAGQAIPGSVQSVVQSRIDGLGAEDRTALQAASVLGQRFALGALRSVMGNVSYQPDR